MKEPTAAAMRAAIEIKEHEISKCGSACDVSDKSLAIIIDSATGLPELIEACEAASYINPKCSCPPGWKTCVCLGGISRKAIAKSKGDTP